MTDENAPADETPDTPPADEVHEEVPDPPTVDDDVPAWGKELQQSVSELATAVAALAHTDNPPADDTGGDTGDVTGTHMPGDGEEIPHDESPVKPPWTHRSIPFFRK